MSLDEHRAPNRLAPMGPARSVSSRKTPLVPTTSYTPRPQRRPERRPDIIDADEDRQWTDDYNSSAPPAQTSGYQYIETAPRSPVQPEGEYEEQLSPLEPSLTTGTLRKQEQYQMLMQSIHLYSDEWKLATIRSDSETNRLVAYLVPRNKRLDLKTAISKNHVMRILIDDRGNIHVQEPSRRGPLGIFASWFRGSS